VSHNSNNHWDLKRLLAFVWCFTCYHNHLTKAFWEYPCRATIVPPFAVWKTWFRTWNPLDKDGRWGNDYCLNLFAFCCCCWWRYDPTISW
jgi:hypothetical protein